MVLLFSDVSECALDLRGRSHVGHTLALEFVFSLLCPGPLVPLLTIRVFTVRRMYFPNYADS